MISITKRLNPKLFFVLCLSMPLASWGGAEDDYLKMLEAEAESSLTDTDSSSEAAKSKQGADLIVDKKELISGVADFENALKREYPESYEMYSQFNEEQKKAVYEHFTKSKRLFNSTLKIISTHLNSN